MGEIKTMDYFDLYLIIVNVVGFLAFVLNTLFYKYSETLRIDGALTILSLLGGSAGILLAIILIDRKPVKEDMMSRVFIACVFVIDVVIFLFIKGHHADHLTLSFWTFFSEYKILILYLVIINIITFAAFALDKIRALEDKVNDLENKRYHPSRIRIITLLGLAFIGGSAGALIAMYLFRHKINLDYFTVGIPLIMIMQIIVLFYMMNFAW